MTKTISELHLEKNGKISDKWRSYLEYYDQLFHRIASRPISMLEIGVQNGGSLETWSKYFINAKNIIGCDIDENCGALSFEDSRIHVVVGDANSEITNTKIRKICENFDFVIDDGSHASHDILNSFLIYFPLVNPGGIYVIEDTHTLYDYGYGGGIFNEFSAMSFFKKLIEMVSFQFWTHELSPNTLFSTFFNGGAIPPFIAEGWVESIEFRNSIITIRKSLRAGHDKRGERIITGNQMIVKDEAWLKVVKG